MYNYDPGMASSLVYWMMSGMASAKQFCSRKRQGEQCIPVAGRGEFEGGDDTCCVMGFGGWWY